MFITFEGGEGAGKTTQIQKLAAFLSDKGRKVIVTREPGGTSEAEKIRDLLVKKNGGAWTPLAEAMLFFTARHMHIETLIKPALKQSKIVLCDRFTDSTIAYQGYGHGFDLEVLKQVQTLSIGDFKPDLTFIFDIDVKKGLSRAGKRMAGSEKESREDKFENLALQFHEKLRQGYLKIAEQNPNRCHVINADQSIESLHREIINEIEPLL
jgi:dTMP kinase